MPIGVGVSLPDGRTVNLYSMTYGKRLWTPVDSAGRTLAEPMTRVKALEWLAQYVAEQTLPEPEPTPPPTKCRRGQACCNPKGEPLKFYHIKSEDRWDSTCTACRNEQRIANEGRVEEADEFTPATYRTEAKALIENPVPDGMLKLLGIKP